VFADVFWSTQRLVYLYLCKHGVGSLPLGSSVYLPTLLTVQEHLVIAVRVTVTALTETTLRCILAKTGSSNVTRLVIRSLGSYEYEAIMLTMG
jgi:hypothetical protein